MGCGATKGLPRPDRDQSGWISPSFTGDPVTRSSSSPEIVQILPPVDFLDQEKQRIETGWQNKGLLARISQEVTPSQSIASVTRTIPVPAPQIKKTDDTKIDSSDTLSTENIDEHKENFENLAAEFKICQTIKSVKDPKLAESLKKLEMLSSIARNEPSDLRRKWARRLVELGFVSLWIKWWPQFWASECVERDAVDLLVPRICFTYAIRVMWNSTDVSHRACRQLAKQNGVAMIIEQLKTPMFEPNGKVNRIRQQQQSTVQRKRYFLNGLLSILHNAMRNCPEAVIQAQNSGGTSTISKFLNTPHEITKLNADICLIYLLPYQRNKEFFNKEECQQQLLNCLKNCLENPEHTSNGFSAETIVDALNHLAAANDPNKLTIASMGAIPLLMKLIQQAQNDYENYTAVKTVWNLSFHPTVKEQIKHESAYMETLNKLRNHTNASISKAANGTLWVLASTVTGLQSSNEQTPITANLSNHVMISYDWSNKATVLILQMALQKAGYRTWMDADHLNKNKEGSTFESTTAAIESAAMMLICMSGRYQNSPACRTEVEYAFRLCKPIAMIRLEANYQPDGWLGALISSKPCFDCSTVNDVTKILPELTKKLGLLNGFLKHFDDKNE